MFAKTALLAASVLLASCAATGAKTHSPSKIVTPEEWATDCKPWDDWDKPAPPIRIHANTYYVGTCGIASILIVGEQQHFLLDTGTEAGSATVLRNIRDLGFEPLDIFAIGYSHEHFDHVGGMAQLIEATGASLVSSPESQAVFATGEDNPLDPQFRNA